MNVTIAVDAMGGDHGPKVTVAAALELLSRDPEVRIILVGQPEPLRTALLKKRASLSDRLTIHAATEVVAMDEPPAQALKKKKDSSMRVAINLVKDSRVIF